jgi:hypothetical protein
MGKIKPLPIRALAESFQFSGAAETLCKQLVFERQWGLLQCPAFETGQNLPL